MNNKKTWAVVGVLVVLIVVYLIWQNQSSSHVASTQPPAQVGTNPQPTPNPIGNPDIGNINPGSTPTPPPSPTAWKDGSYTGSVADAIYGPMQVKAVISGGKLTDVQFVQYPTNGGHTQELSQQVLPQLKQEAIAAQSANVNIISGATQDSTAFQQSLANALAQAS